MRCKQNGMKAKFPVIANEEDKHEGKRNRSKSESAAENRKCQEVGIHLAITRTSTLLSSPRPGTSAMPVIHCQVGVSSNWKDLPNYDAGSVRKPSLSRSSESKNVCPNVTKSAERCLPKSLGRGLSISFRSGQSLILTDLLAASASLAGNPQRAPGPTGPSFIGPQYAVRVHGTGKKSENE